jgi:hypothetical protein
MGWDGRAILQAAQKDIMKNIVKIATEKFEGFLP